MEMNMTCRSVRIRHLSRRLFLLLPLILLVAGLASRPSQADDPASDRQPRAFLQAIYAHYIGGDNAPGLNMDTDDDYKRYFSPAMAKIMIEAHKHATPDEVPAWGDFDFFVDAQEWIIASVKIDVDDKPASGQTQGSDRTQVRVSFVNEGKPVTVLLDLLHVNDGWRIDNIHWGNKTLRHIYTQ
jgi:hypothetical protein